MLGAGVGDDDGWMAAQAQVHCSHLPGAQVWLSWLELSNYTAPEGSRFHSHQRFWV